MFRPDPTIERLPLHHGRQCLIIDDALLAPERLRDWAVSQRAQFAPAPHNAYPGLELRMPDAFSAQLDDYFRRHLRARFGARRTLRMYSRLALATLPPAELRPAQWICHCDRLGFAPGQRIVASVLYLFDDPALGGTAFFRPLRGSADTAAMVLDSERLDAAAFSTRYGIRPGYMTTGNAWFEHVRTVPARWNRLIVYDADAFHTGEIRAPERLDPDPARGRLTLNGFFTCSAAAR